MRLSMEKKKVLFKMFMLVWAVPRWIFVQIFRWPFYDGKYLKGKWFKSILSPGWQWAYEDLLHRIFTQKNVGVPWPVSPYMTCGSKIKFDVDDINNFNGSGSYFQTISGEITIGKGTWIAQNVGLITTNHDPENLDEHLPGKDIVLGEHCWIGMNSVVLPGVVLGPHTIVGAGAVVTKSFPEGYCVIGGNPARIIKKLPQEVSSNGKGD